MKNPTERLLAQKALNGKLRRTESKQSLLQINKEKQIFEQIVHRRKEVVANEIRKKSPNFSRLKTKKPSSANGDRNMMGRKGVLVNDVDIMSRVDKLNAKMQDRRRKVTNVIDRPRTTQNGRSDLMCNRRESERAVLKLAYKVRASANQRPEVHVHERMILDKMHGSTSSTSLVGSFGG